MKLKKLLFLLFTLSLALQTQAEEKKITVPSSVKNISRHHLTAAAKGIGALICSLGLFHVFHQEDFLAKSLTKNDLPLFCSRLARYAAIEIVLIYVACKLGESCLKDLKKIIKKRWNRAPQQTKE